MQTFAQRQLSFQLERMADQMLKHGNRPPKRKNSKSFGSTQSAQVQGCDCDVLPWENCEHTEQTTDQIKPMMTRAN